MQIFIGGVSRRELLEISVNTDNIYVVRQLSNSINHEKENNILVHQLSEHYTPGNALVHKITQNNRKFPYLDYPSSISAKIRYAK